MEKPVINNPSPSAEDIQKQKEKELAFLQKFQDRVRMWVRAHTDKHGNLTAPLPITFTTNGDPIWLNRRTRRRLQKGARKWIRSK